MNHGRFLLMGILALASSAAVAQDAMSPVSGTRGDASQSGVRSSSPTLRERDARYRLRAGDSFDLDFALSPEFNQTVSVQPDGYGSLKAVGTIPVSGKTIPELTEAIKSAYAELLHDPLLVVILKDFDKPYFIAGGQVGKPGKYDLREDLTITEAISIAGGLSDKGKISEVVLYRKLPGGSFEGKVFNLKRMLASHNLSEDPRLVPGDLVYVPQTISSHFRPLMPLASMGLYYSTFLY